MVGAHFSFRGVPLVPKSQHPIFLPGALQCPMMYPTMYTQCPLSCCTLGLQYPDLLTGTVWTEFMKGSEQTIMDHPKRQGASG